MALTVTVNVTQEDIDKGCIADSVGAKGGCMVYRGFMRATEGAFTDAVVLTNEIWLRQDPGLRTGIKVRLPANVQRRIQHFDAGRRCTPFAFDLELPDSLFAVPS